MRGLLSIGLGVVLGAVIIKQINTLKVKRTRQELKPETDIREVLASIETVELKKDIES